MYPTLKAAESIFKRVSTSKVRGPDLFFSHLVDDNDIVAAGQQGVRHPAPDEPGRPGDQDSLLPGVRRHLSRGRRIKKKWRAESTSHGSSVCVTLGGTTQEHTPALFALVDNAAEL